MKPEHVPLNIPTDQRGKITSGYRNERGNPQSVPHFMIDDFPELQAVYGEEPKELIVYFPTNSLMDFGKIIKDKWGTSKEGNHFKVRECNGQECLHHIPETLQLRDEAGVFHEESFGEGELTDCVCKRLAQTVKDKKTGKDVTNPKLCMWDIWFKAWVANPNTGPEYKVMNWDCYLFSNHSARAASEFFWKFFASGQLIGIPFSLKVEWVVGANMSYPVWHIDEAEKSNLLETHQEAFKRLSGGLELDDSYKALPEAEWSPADIKTEEKPATEGTEQENHATDIVGATKEQGTEYLKIIIKFGQCSTVEALEAKALELKPRILALPKVLVDKVNEEYGIKRKALKDDLPF
jgi:hypothetical protein